MPWRRAPPSGEPHPDPREYTASDQNATDIREACTHRCSTVPAPYPGAVARPRGPARPARGVVRVLVQVAAPLCCRIPPPRRGGEEGHHPAHRDGGKCRGSSPTWEVARCGLVRSRAAGDLRTPVGPHLQAGMDPGVGGRSASVGSVVCFYVWPRWRQRGITLPLLQAAVAFASSRVARVAEGSSVDRVSRGSPRATAVGRGR